MAIVMSHYKVERERLWLNIQKYNCRFAR